MMTWAICMNGCLIISIKCILELCKLVKTPSNIQQAWLGCESKVDCTSSCGHGHGPVRSSGNKYYTHNIYGLELFISQGNYINNNQLVTTHVIIAQMLHCL